MSNRSVLPPRRLPEAPRDPELSLEHIWVLRTVLSAESPEMPLTDPG
jgi:hypothetical protein